MAWIFYPCLLLFIISCDFFNNPPQPNKKPVPTTDIGEYKEVDIQTRHPYSQYDLTKDTPQVVWSDTIHDPGADALAVHFKNFNLAKGDYIIISSRDGKHTWRYNFRGRQVGEEFFKDFWSVSIPGDTIIISLYSQSPNPKYGFEIDNYSRIMLITQEPCNANNSLRAQCLITNPKYLAAKPVAKLFTNATTPCTGWLVGSGGYLLTNRHCVTNSTGAVNTDIIFMYESTLCNQSCDLTTNTNCRNTIHVEGVQFITSNFSLDYTLLKIPDNDPNFVAIQQLGYLQMRASGPNGKEGIYIPQHPLPSSSTDTDDKKVALQSRISKLNSEDCLQPAKNSFNHNAYVNNGSSGSPIISTTDNLVIGLHECRCGTKRGNAIQIDKIINDLIVKGELPLNSVACNAECLNGGTCQNGTCICLPGYGGENCSDVLSEAVARLFMLPINQDNLSIERYERRYRITDNDKFIAYFPTSKEAEQALAVLQGYDIDTRASFRDKELDFYFFLVDNDIPSSKIPNEDCIRIRNIENLTIRQQGDNYTIIDGNSTPFSVSSKRTATDIIEILQYFKVKDICYVGRPDASMIYLKK